MTSAQKIIKYLAIAFAVFLIVNIISAILFGINGLASALGLKKESKTNVTTLEEMSYSIYGTDIATLKIELNYSNLKIQKGKFFKAESNDLDIVCKQNKNQIEIKEKNKNIFKNKMKDLVVYVPAGFKFDDVSIIAGAGEVNIEELNTDKLYFQMGAGKVEIDKLNVYKQAKIEGGAGQVNISSGEMNNLDLDMGIGENIVNSKLRGKAKINAGIGKISINLEDNISNYTIRADKGIGAIRVNGKNMADGTEYGKGKNYIDVNGGIGEIKINSKN